VICNSATAFRAEVDGRRLSFEEEGIWGGVFVMRDRETGTLWSHYTGEAVQGPAAGTSLQWEQVHRMRTSRALDAFPSALTPAPSSLAPGRRVAAKGRGDALGDGLPGAFVPTLGPPQKEDRRLPRHEHGLGLFVAGSHRFYPLDRLQRRALVQEEVGGVAVAVLVQDGGEAAAAYGRCVDGVTLSFESAAHEGRIAMTDRETGSVWLSTGLAVAGPHKGAQLTPLRSIVTDWYGWAAYFARTTIYEAVTAPTRPGSAP